MRRDRDVSGRRHYDPEKMRRQQKYQYLFAALLFLLIPLVLYLLFRMGIQKKHYMLLSILVLLGTMLPFLIRFDRRETRAREVVFLALMTAFCVTANLLCSHTVPLHAGTTLVLLTGISLGPEAGFLVGALSRLLCNFFDGQGPWTPWQMITWGMLGLLSGFLFFRTDTRRKETHIWRENILALTGYTFLSVFLLYGGMMNFAAFLMNHTLQPAEYPMKKEVIKAIYITGIPYDLTHAGGAALCMFLFGETFLRRIQRVQIKYGISLSENGRRIKK